jgi:hypothetical protein
LWAEVVEPSVKPARVTAENAQVQLIKHYCESRGLRERRHDRDERVRDQDPC